MQAPPFARDTGRKTTATVECPKSMVGRVIGKNGDTIKALQNYTGSLIQVNQVDDPCQITISGTQQSLSLAMSMVADIVRGTFKGFALLRQLAGPPLHQQHQLPRPIYAPGYGLIPSTQFLGADGLPRDSAEGAIPISAIDPAALMGWGGMGLPEQWQQNSNLERVMAQQQLSPNFILPMTHPSVPQSSFNPYNPSQVQGMPQQVQFHGGVPNSDPYGLAALYARQGMNPQEAFLAAGGYQDLGPLLAAASAQPSDDQARVQAPLNLTGGIPQTTGGGNMRMPPSVMPQMGSQPHLAMMGQAPGSSNWLNYQGQDEERQAFAISQAQQQQLLAVSDMMAKAKLNEEPPSSQGEREASKKEPANGNAMRRDAEGNYYFNNAGAGLAPAAESQ